MPISKINELIGASPDSFEDAAQRVIARAHRTLRGIQGFAVVEKRVKVEAGGIREYRVRLRLEFEMAPETALHF